MGSDSAYGEPFYGEPADEIATLRERLAAAESRAARVEAALLSLAWVGEDEDGQPVLRISCGFRCQTPDTTVLPLVWAALAEIGGEK